MPATSKKREPSKDPWIEVIGDALGDRYGKIKTEGIWTIVNVAVERRSQNENQRLGEAMRVLGWNHAQRRFGGGKREWGYWCAEDPESRYLPVTYVNRDFEGLVDVIVGQLEIETEKEPLSAMLRKARAAR